MLHLTLHESMSIPIEAEMLTPDRLIDKSITEIEKLPIQQGNTQLVVADFFQVRGDASDGFLVVEGDCGKIKSIGQLMSGGKIRVEGNAGMHLGAGMTGGVIEVAGNVAEWAGAEMRGGTIHVRGNAGDSLGSVYRGGTAGMRGGVIRVDGDAGHEVGANLRRGLIAIGGKCGDFAGISMIAGTLIVANGVGAHPGAGMKRGTIAVLNGPAKLPPTFRFNCIYQPLFLRYYLRQLREWGLLIPAEADAQPFRRFSGDMLALGKGEILVSHN
jgi:formylmethanofuran dehydrogenase subunit C